MNAAGGLKISDKVRDAFAPLLKALPSVRQALAAAKDVVAVRPGFYYPATGKPVPAIVVAVRPGAAPVNAADLTKKFGVAFSVTDATVEEQVAALDKEAGAVAFGGPEGPTASAFEALLSGAEGGLEFGPPKTGAY